MKMTGELLKLLVTMAGKKEFTTDDISEAFTAGYNARQESIDIDGVVEIAHMLESSITKKAPFTLYTIQSDGSHLPYEVSREHYLDFVMNNAMESLYSMMSEFIDDNGELKQSEEDE